MLLIPLQNRSSPWTVAVSLRSALSLAFADLRPALGPGFGPGVRPRPATLAGVGTPVLRSGREGFRGLCDVPMVPIAAQSTDAR